MMKVIGSNFQKISIEKENEIQKGMKITTNIDIKGLKRRDIDVFKDKDIFDFEYEFNIEYVPNVSKINFKGNLLVLITEKELVQKLEENWKDKKVIEELRIPIMNLIFTRCNLKALQLEEDLGLPPHIPSPKLEAVKKEE